MKRERLKGFIEGFLCHVKQWNRDEEEAVDELIEALSREREKNDRQKNRGSSRSNG